MKRGMFLFIFLVFILLAVNFVSAESSSCPFKISLLNQDPYPAIPGDYVDVVFQVKEISDPDCGILSVQLKEVYPFSLDPGESSTKEIRTGVFDEDFGDFFLATYKIRVSKDALEGNNTIEVLVFNDQYPTTSFSKEFEIKIEDSLTEFEIHVKDYSFETKKLVLEVLNIGEKDVEAVTIEIPNQENVQIFGSDKVIVGSVDSNEEETASFEGDLKTGQIKVILKYTDQIGERRILETSVEFKGDNFIAQTNGKKEISKVQIFLIGFGIPVVLYIILRFLRKRKERRKKRLGLSR